MRHSVEARPIAVELSERLRAAFPELAARDATLVQRIAHAGMVRHMSAGAVLFSERTPCTGFPLLLSGSVRVVQRYPNGRELQLYRVKAGELCVLSGSCLLSDVEYNATAIAETDVEVLVLAPAAFSALLAGDEAFRRYVFGGIGRRMSELMQLVEAIAYHQLHTRLARALLERAGSSDATIQATHQALADALGSVREMVSRLLRNFEDRGLIKLGRERITIVDRAGLTAVAAER